MTQLLRTGQVPRAWSEVGGGRVAQVVGLSTYNKWLVILLVLSIIGGLLLAGPRQVLLSRAFLAATALAVVTASPNLVWQAIHGLART